MLSSSLACPQCGHQLRPPITTPSSPVPELSHTSSFVSQPEASILKGKLDIVGNDLSRLDSDIEQTQTRLALLKHERARLQRYSGQLRGVISALRRFPPELLAQIFGELDRPDSRAAYVPTQVCRVWRAVALSTASLWISFYLRLRDGKEHHDILQARQYLSCSGGLPISFTLGLYGRPNGPWHPCIQLLVANAHRWKHATLYLPSSKMGDFRGVENNLPLLESLEIGFLNPDSTHHPLLYADFGNSFLDAPRLHTLTLNTRVSEHIIQVPWAQLTNCKFDGQYTIIECYDLIQNCHNLRHCEISLWYEDEVDTAHLPMIIRPTIKELLARGSSSLQRLLDRLELPGMTLFDHLHRGPGPSEDITSLFSRSSPPLSCLHLESDCTDSTHTALIDCLKQCPSLRELSLLRGSASGVNAQLLRWLTHFPDDSSCCLVPELQYLSVSTLHDFNFEAFTTMVESRWRHHGRDCHGPDHRPVVRIKGATLRRSYLHHAEDAVENRDEDEPPWLDLLHQLLDEGFLLVSQDHRAKDITLKKMLLKHYDPGEDLYSEPD